MRCTQFVILSIIMFMDFYKCDLRRCTEWSSNITCQQINSWFLSKYFDNFTCILWLQFTVTCQTKSINVIFLRLNSFVNSYCMMDNMEMYSMFPYIVGLSFVKINCMIIFSPYSSVHCFIALWNQINYISWVFVYGV